MTDRVEVRDRARIQIASSGVVGPAGASVTLRREEPLGAVDGVNDTFTTSSAFVANSTVFYLNGLAQSVPDDYAETSSTEIVMVDPPLPGDRLLIVYPEA